MTPEIRTHRLGCTLRLAVRPGAPRDRILGEGGGALRLAVAAPPERGRANRAVLRFLAKGLSLPRADLELIGGETSRSKVVLFRGMGPDQLAERLGAAMSDRQGRSHP
jgi:uncharacterized protein (TIGR00251 family)